MKIKIYVPEADFEVVIPLPTSDALSARSSLATLLCSISAHNPTMDWTEQSVVDGEHFCAHLVDLMGSPDEFLAAVVTLVD